MFTIKKKIRFVVICIIPIVLLMIGIVADIMILPRIYGENVFFMSQLFIDPEKTIYTLINPYAMLPGITRGTKVLMQILTGIWLFGFIISLYFFCRELHFKSKPVAANAAVMKKEVYLIVQEVGSVLTQLKRRKSNEKLNNLIYSVKCLEEKLSVESDFGYGNDEVIACENDIMKHIKILLDNALHIGTEGFEEDVCNLNEEVIYINALLRKRSELKRLQ